jgi:hypothetical protein
VVFNSKISMTCNLWEFRPVEHNVIWDISSPPSKDLMFLPVLSFLNPQVHPHGSKLQLHGIILHSKGTNIYERVGYFWTTDDDAIRRFSPETSQNFKTHTILLE